MISRVLPWLCTLLTAGSAFAFEWPLPPARTGLLYLSGWSSNNLGELRPDGTPIRTISVPGLTRPRGVSVDASGNLVVVTEQNAQIFVLDLYGNVLRTVSHPDLTSGTGIAQSPSGDWYIGNFSPGGVLVFDASWNHRTTIRATGMNGVKCVAFEPSGGFAVSAAISNRVYLFDANHNPGNTVSHPSMGSPMSIALDSQGDHYLSNGGTGVVIKFDASWNPLFVFGASVLAQPQGIVVDEFDRLTITNFSSSTVHRYGTGGQLLGSFTLQNVSVARNLTFQTSPYVLARHGSVNRAGGFPEPVLVANSVPPDAMGRVTFRPADPLTVFLSASPAGPAPAPFVLYAYPGEPGPGEVEFLPLDAGLFAFRTPLGGGQPVTLLAAAAPTPVLALPRGLGFQATATLQGLLFDVGSTAAPALPVSATNAIVLQIR